jgi:hypothetical protein
MYNQPVLDVGCRTNDRLLQVLVEYPAGSLVRHIRRPYAFDAEAMRLGQAKQIIPERFINF